MKFMQNLVLRLFYSTDICLSLLFFLHHFTMSLITSHLDIVWDQLAEWVQEGFVEQLQALAHCCNPLGVAVKYDASADKLKYHPVL
jgi:hypothetical protein